MATTELLEGVLEGSQIPHQPLLIITETVTQFGLPLFTETLRRSEQAGRGSVLVTALHDSAAILPRGSSSKVVDLTDCVPGYGSSADGLAGLEKRIRTEFASAGEKASIYIDAIDILAEDYSISATMKLFRNLLQLIKDSKAPSRLVLLIPAHSSLLPSLIPPNASSTLTLLTPHPPSLLSYLSKAYLTPIEASPKYWQILETATSRHLGDDLSFKGELETSSNIIVQTLVRKAAGGSKGISRSLEAFTETGKVEKVSNVMEVMPVSNAVGPGGSGVAPKTHADLDLSFNLNLTDSQKAARMGVPLPYAHEGEGAAVDLEIDDEDDEDDEEI